MVEALHSGSKKDALQRVQFGNFDIMSDTEGRPLALGKGTFGRTYQACHRYLDTIVALKIINERYATDAGVRQRFLVEARAVARLSHPHIARLYDFGEVDGVLHYAMEFCGGGSLADYVAKNGPLGLQQLVEVGQQIAGALKCAHAAGFIHRDLKPSNIMLTEAKGPLFTKLIDFGLVQPSLPESTGSVHEDQSADGARFLGTPLFASPEQLKEEPMDIRTDLFSLGMTLWFLTLGRAPEGGSSAEIAARRLSPESYAKQLPANLPAQLRDVLARLLQKDRRNRFASASEAFAAFNVCATGLGFRRARDYTSATEPTEWDEPAAVPVPEQVVKAEPTEIERVEADLDSEFKIVTRINDDFTGSNYLAESKAEGGALVFLHVLHPALVEDASTFDLLRVHMTQLKALNAPEILQPQALRSYSDYVSIVIDRPGGTDLLSILRTERVVHLLEAAPLLESIANVCDGLAAAGLPGPQLAPAHIFVEWPDGASQPNGGASARQLSNARPKLYPRFLAVSEAPELARLNEPEDASSTMTSDMLGDPSRADNVCEHFGILLYRIVAGRNCPIAASLSSQAYIPVPGLSEQANRTLALVIAKQIAVASCGQVLREILGAEGIAPRSPGHPSAGFTVPGSGSTVVPPSATPPSSLRTPSKTSTASGSTASSSRFRPMPVAPPAAAPPPLIIPPRPVVPPPEPEPAEAAGARLAEVEEAPVTEALTPPIPKAETTPAKTSAKKSRPKTAKIRTADIEPKEEKARAEPPAVVPPPLEAVTVLNEKIEPPPISVSPPKVAIPPVPVVPEPGIAQNIVPWVGRNIRPIGIGIAALLAVSVAYGFIQKMRSPDKTTTTSASTQHDEPVLEPAKAIVPTTAAAATDTEQAKIRADELRAEQQAADEAKLAAKKADEEAKASADRLAEQQKVTQPDPSKLAPAPETAPNANAQEAPKVRSQKQAQKDSQSSHSSGGNHSSQSANRPAPVAPPPRPPPVQRPANNSQRPKSEFGPSAPGG
jgi:serine/threonine protein kinase